MLLSQGASSEYQFSDFSFADAEVAVPVVVDTDGDFAKIVEKLKTAVGENWSVVEMTGRISSSELEGL